MAKHDPTSYTVGVLTRVVGGSIGLMSFIGGLDVFLVCLFTGEICIAMGGLAATGFGIQIGLLTLIYDRVAPLDNEGG